MEMPILLYPKEILLSSLPRPLSPGENSIHDNPDDMCDASVTIRRRLGQGVCQRGFLLGPNDEFRGIVEALWEAFERGLRAALQGGAGTGCQWSIASLSAPESLDVLLASPYSDPHWPSPAPVGTGSRGLTSALGPRTRHVRALCAVAATLRASLDELRSDQS